LPKQLLTGFSVPAQHRPLAAGFSAGFPSRHGATPIAGWFLLPPSIMITFIAVSLLLLVLLLLMMMINEL